MRPLRVVAAVSLVLIAGICVKAFLVFKRESAVFRPRRGPVDWPTPEVALEGLRGVSFRSTGNIILRGWMLPSRNGAAVILTHGAEADRSQLLPEARILVQHGYGVLMFDWPGHGESDGTVVWGEPERRALEAAIDLVSAEPGVDVTRIGALGFSMGGAIVAQVAARDSRLRAVVLEGTFADALEQTRFEYGRSGFLMQWPARLAGQLAGMDTRRMRPVDAVPALQPRPLLLIAGGADLTVPAWMVRRLYDAAGQPKEMWTIPNATHGGYDQLEPDEYRDRLRRFFDGALSPTPN